MYVPRLSNSTITPGVIQITINFKCIGRRPSAATTSLFNQARVAAPQPLINAGLSATGQAPGLLGQGTSSLGLSTNTQGDIRNYEMQQRQMKNQFWSSLGSGIFNLATAPFGGANKSLLGRIS